jgi:hypothetical protein
MKNHNKANTTHEHSTYIDKKGIKQYYKHLKFRKWIDKTPSSPPLHQDTKKEEDSKAQSDYSLSSLS